MVKNLQRYSQLKNPGKGYLIINPIMVGGILPGEAQHKLLDEEWIRTGYAVCFDCLEGRSSLIRKPNVQQFLGDLAEFLGGSVAEHSFGCRAAQFAAMKAVADRLMNNSEKHGNVIVADPLCHYTTNIAAEMVGFKLVTTQAGQPPTYQVGAQGFQNKIDEIKKATGKLPAIIVVTHVDPYYGNLNPVEEVGKIAEEYEIPYLINAAYTAGVMPVDMNAMRADFLTVSAHKSMASIGPLGFLVVNSKWSELAFDASKSVKSVGGRALTTKLPNFFGCSVGAAPLISAMLTFPYVVERVRRWDDELEKTLWFISELEKLDNVKQYGDRPHRHHLVHFETPIFGEISQHHKRRGFFLAEDLEKHGITGIQRGLSKHLKLSVYGLKWDQVKEVRDAFYEIAEEYVSKYHLNYNAPVKSEVPERNGAKS
jgi:Sep-tRNA:Cys-tRNA synthetase